jgi:hypothetical protein
MNTFSIWFGICMILFVALLIAKSRRRGPHEDIDWKAQNLQITEENGDLRVLAGGHSYLIKGIRREGFLRQYQEAWNRIRLNLEPPEEGYEIMGFTPAEQLSLRQKIALFWLYVYNVNDRRFKFLWWSMSDSQTRTEVLQAAEAKYGTKSEKAIGLAAHTLNMSKKRFKRWMKRDEEFANR